MKLAPDYFRVDSLAIFIGMFIWFFSLLITVYSMGYLRSQRGILRYYLYIFLTLLASLGVVFANNLIIFMVFWGLSGFLLYLLIGYGKKESTPATAKKALILIAGSDAFMLLGIGLIWKLTGLFEMDLISLPLTAKSAVAAYLCLAAASFAKAGAMPLHTWVPDTAQDAPVPVAAYLPAALDKLLGIYFLARISLEMFQLDLAMNTFLMFMGSFTIVAAVMMALIQHEFKRLLGYHAVSQVGYMILGIGTGTTIGIAGGLFHMLNNAIYKSCLFLCSGAVEQKTKTTDLAKLGGLVKYMPITFVTFLIAALAISGVPPLNGFVSKWMIYQGIIKVGAGGGKIWMVWLVSAMFGSALTLASFMKLIHTVFLGQASLDTFSQTKHSEAGPLLWLPGVVLAFLCVIFGIFAYQIPLKNFVFPSILEPVEFFGTWNAGGAAVLMLAGIALGLIIYFLGMAPQKKESDIFIGGEELKQYPQMRVSGSEFYNTIKEINILKSLYNKAQAGWFDIYEQGKNFIFALGKFLQYLHNGILSTYLVWVLLGMLGLFWVLLK